MKISVCFYLILFVANGLGAMHPIYSAIQDKNIEKLKTLITNQNVNSIIDEKYNRTALNYAVFNDLSAHYHATLDILHFLLKNGANPNFQDEALRTPLHYNPDLLIIKILLKHGACPDIKNENGSTPLLLVTDGSAECFAKVRLFLRAGADPLVKNKFGLSPLEKARMLFQQNHIEIKVVAILEEYAHGFSREAIFEVSQS